MNLRQRSHGRNGLPVELATCTRTDSGGVVKRISR